MAKWTAHNSYLVFLVLLTLGMSAHTSTTNQKIKPVFNGVLENSCKITSFPQESCRWLDKRGIRLCRDVSFGFYIIHCYLGTHHSNSSRHNICSLMMCILLLFRGFHPRLEMNCAAIRWESDLWNKWFLLKLSVH
jgi:hypothetical protein